mmetsp:Transcript_166777/g.320252  ORF Transcript_166777/g.320252 Transcript_166777/m.320252 type:complete len:488 (+) Transcript_166777:69-1532(+)
MAGAVRIVRHVPAQTHLHGQLVDGSQHEHHLRSDYDGSASPSGARSLSVTAHHHRTGQPGGDNHADGNWDDDPLDVDDKAPGQPGESAGSDASRGHGAQREGDCDNSDHPGGVQTTGSNEAQRQGEALNSNELYSSQDSSGLQSPNCWYQTEVRHFYHSHRVQQVVAGVIAANFVIQCFQSQVDPFGDEHEDVWFVTENFFNVVFLLELMLNMYGSWFRPFWRKKWNIFDFVVVTIGVLDMMQFPMGALNLARMLRAFRVFRLFGRIESLRKTISMIQKALPGVMSAFLIAIIMLCIYAVLATHLFKEIYDNCHSPEMYDVNGAILVPVALTGRQNCFGYEYYGNFLKSLYTLFQILTGESWSEAGVRPLIFRFSSDILEVTGVGLFFLSFIMINGIIIVNVVVAFLIDGILGEEKKQEEEAHEKHQENAPPQVLFDGTEPEVALMLRDLNSSRERLAAFRRDALDILSKIEGNLNVDPNTVGTTSV